MIYTVIERHVETFTDKQKFVDRLREIEDMNFVTHAGVDADGWWFVLIHKTHETREA